MTVNYLAVPLWPCPPSQFRRLRLLLLPREWTLRSALAKYRQMSASGAAKRAPEELERIAGEGVDYLCSATIVKHVLKILLVDAHREVFTGTYDRGGSQVCIERGFQKNKKNHMLNNVLIK